jgi:hypothetical protein
MYTQSSLMPLDGAPDVVGGWELGDVVRCRLSGGARRQDQNDEVELGIASQRRNGASKVRNSANSSL